MTRAKKKRIRKTQMQQAKLQVWWEANKDKKLYDDNHFLEFTQKVVRA